MQVAAEAATGEFDNLGDPADLRDLVSSDSAITDADIGGYSSMYPPLSRYTFCLVSFYILVLWLLHSDQWRPVALSSGGCLACPAAGMNLMEAVC